MLSICFSQMVWSMDIMQSTSLYRKFISFTSTVDSRYNEVEGPSETFRDNRTSTYQICRIEENTNQTTKLHK